MNIGHSGNENDNGNRSSRTQTCPSAILTTMYHTQTGLGLNPGRCDDRPMTDRLSHAVKEI